MTETAIFEASRPFGLAMCAMLAESSGVARERRVLIVAATEMNPELTVPLHRRPESAKYLEQFGAVFFWNELLGTWHPYKWSPKYGSIEASLAENTLAASFGIGELDSDEITLYLESIQVAPSRALANIFPKSHIHVYADGLMTYGGIRNGLDAFTEQRIEALHYVDLVPGLRPMAFGYLPIEYEPISVERFAQRQAHDLNQAPSVEDQGDRSGVAVVVGQYLADLGLLTVEEDRLLLRRMIDVAIATGSGLVLVKPHPATSSELAEALVGEYRRAGAAVELVDSTEPLEQWLARIAPTPGRATVISSFSTALATSKAAGYRAIAVGTARMLDRLEETNSNRVPVIVCDAFCDTVALDGPLEVAPAKLTEARDLQLLVDIVTFVRFAGDYWASFERIRSAFRDAPSEVRDVIGGYVSDRRLSQVALTPKRPQGLLRVVIWRWAPSWFLQLASRLVRAGGLRSLHRVAP